MTHRLLPEEDAIDDPDANDDVDPTIPGDLWFRRERGRRVVYSAAVAASQTLKPATS
jgi:hypothetical protein